MHAPPSEGTGEANTQTCTVGSLRSGVAIDESPKTIDLKDRRRGWDAATVLQTQVEDDNCSVFEWQRTKRIGMLSTG